MCSCNYDELIVNLNGFEFVIVFYYPLQEKKRSERVYNVILNFLRLMLKDVQANL
jgi:hypothetical protein